MSLMTAGREMRTINALLSAAEDEARRGGDAVPGPEHLLVAAMDLADGTAASALARFGVDTGALRTALEGVHAQALASVGLPGPDTAAGPGLSGPAAGLYRSTPQAEQVFQEAVALSKTSSPSRLLGAHVVAAVCALEHGTPALALAALGVDRGELRAAALTQANEAAQRPGHGR